MLPVDTHHGENVGSVENMMTPKIFIRKLKKEYPEHHSTNHALKIEELHGVLYCANQGDNGGEVMSKQRINSKRKCARCKQKPLSGKRYLFLHQSQYVCANCFEIIDYRHQIKRVRQKLNFVRNVMDVMDPFGSAIMEGKRWDTVKILTKVP